MRFLAAVFVLVATPAIAQQLDGTFTLRTQSDDPDRVNLNLHFSENNSSYGRNVQRSEFSNVVRNGDKVTFTLRRDPGTFTFEGRGSIEHAVGWFDFAPNAGFQQQMERIGFRGVDARALFTFAFEDLSIDKVKQLQKLVSDTLDTDELVRLMNHGAGVKYIQAMTDAGFKHLSSDEYRRARDHGVTAEYAKEMAKRGMDASLEELVRTRDHGVSADFLQKMSALGYDKLPIEDYVRMRDHGVTPEFVESMRDVGYKDLSPNELVRLRDHGVSATYVRRIRDLYKEHPSVDQIIRMRDRGERGME